MASGWASQSYFPDREVVGRVVAHALYTENFEVAPVHPNDVIPSQSEDGALSDLCPSLQVPKPAVLSEVPD